MGGCELLKKGFCSVFKFPLSLLMWISDGSWSKFFDPGRVRHLWFGFEFWKFPLKTSNFSIIFPSGQKKSLRVGSESTRVGLLFIAGQK